MNQIWLRLRSASISTFLVSLLFASTLDAQPSSISIDQNQGSSKPLSSLKPGEASGSMTIRENTVELKFAYARKIKGRFDPTKEEYKVLLTSQPVSDAVLKSGEDLFDAFMKADGLYLYIDSERRIVSISLAAMIVREVKGGGKQSSNVNFFATVMGEYVKIDGESIRAESQDEEKNSSGKYGYTVAFNAIFIK